MFPITIGSFELPFLSNGLPNAHNPDRFISICPKGSPPLPTPCVPVSFWNPVRAVDVTKNPYCFVNLGGMTLDMGKHVGTGHHSRSNGHGGGSWNVHWYIYPLFVILELVTDFICLDYGMDFDIAYISELDPLWDDDSVTALINPEGILFGNPIAQAACAADCASATVDDAINTLFWCAGCQGGMYPLNGHIQAHIGSIQSSLLAAERFIYKLHREGLNKDTWSSINYTGDCVSSPTLKPSKKAYRTQLTNPVSSDCYPFGRSTTLYESGKEIPIVGEDFGYLIWKKRACCVL